MNEIGYLFKLSEQNINHVTLILRTIFGLTTVITFAFLGVLGFILRELWKMRKETKLAEEERKKIEEHEQRFISLVEQVEETKNQIEEMKNTVRDISLEAKKIVIVDNEIRNLIKDGLNEEYKPHLINSIKDFVWGKNIMDLNDLREGLNDKDLVEKIKNEYSKVQEIEIPGIDLMKAAYAMKKEGKKLKDVVPQEKIGLGRWIK